MASTGFVLLTAISLMSESVRFALRAAFASRLLTRDMFSCKGDCFIAMFYVRIAPAGTWLLRTVFMDITELLAFTAQQNASDLHLSIGLPPMIRVDSDIRCVNVPPNGSYVDKC